ncbi:28 kDa ribonucleoprotein, chloroplastic-like protein [Drosera capensis]
MVLSNKKLKQKRRADLLATNASNTISNNAQTEDDSTTTTQRKPGLAKREKRRVNKRKTGVVDEINGEKRGSQKGKDGKGDEVKSGIDGDNFKGKKRKRGDEGDDAEDSDVRVKRKENKKKKKKKEKRRDGDRDIGVNEGLGNESQSKKKVKKKKAKKKEEGQKIGGMLSEAAFEPVGEKIEETNCDGILSREIINKVYVGGIPYYSTEDDIRSFFDHCGTITIVDCMKFTESGKFRGIAIISFKTEEAAKRALALDGADMGGLFLKIETYKATRETKTSNFAPPIVEGYNRIYVGNLAWDITEDDLRKLFLDSVISSIRFGEDKETGEFKGYAHVDFSDKNSLTKALTLDQTVVCGRPVRIRCAVQKKAVDQKKSVDQKISAMAQGSSPAQIAPKANDDGAISKKIKGRTCYDCGERGHISSSCPKKQVADQP